METQIIAFILVGFIAQMIDGALGMAYGITVSTFLLNFGISPAVASATLHTAEVIITGISGISHWRFGNTHVDLIKRLLIPGVLGGVIGAYLLSSVDNEFIKPVIAVYLFVMGVLIIRKSFSRWEGWEMRIGVIPLGFFGGLMDAIGGGGWGPIVTSTLVAQGHNPRFAVGSVNAIEFFVTVAQSATFILTMGPSYLEHWRIILGLLIGGALAAPLAGVLVKKLPYRPFMRCIGILIIVLSLRMLYLTWRR